MIASKKGYLSIVKLLLEHGADIESRQNDGRRALMWAALSGHFDVVKILVAYGACVGATDHQGKSALSYTSIRADVETGTFLLEAASGVQSL